MATHALHVGINDYRGGEFDLAGCVNDARNNARLFGKRRRGAVRDALDNCQFFGDAASQVLLFDRTATRTRILAELMSLLRKLGKGDTGIFTFSGHGTYVRDVSGDEPDQHDEALVCYGLDAILDDEFGGLIERRAVGSRLIIVTDSCNSGTATRSFGPRLMGPTDPNQNYRFMPPARIAAAGRKTEWRVAMKRAPRAVDVIHFAACQDNEFAADAMIDNVPCGAFNHYFLETLCELEKGSTYGDLRDAIAQKLPSRDYDQTPQTNAYARALAWKLPSR